MALMVLDTQIERIPSLDWEDFSRSLVWSQGEHVALIGPTGSGKTTLLLSLLQRRRYVVVVGTKPRDRTLARLRHRGFVRLEKWRKGLDPNVHPKRLLWPDATDVDSEVRQRAEILNALRIMYREGGWCVAVDELSYLINTLKLEKTFKTYLQQARSLDISVVCATQRPAFIPLEVYDQSTHLFFWRDNDERNLSRISGISYLSANLVKDAVAHLDKHEVLYINTRDGVLCRTFPPPPEATTERG